MIGAKKIRKKFRNGTLGIIFLIGIATFVGLAISKNLNQHEPLRFKNTFSKPEEVVKYYCARDASGFVWSGLLDIERRAFTTWASVPNQDSFYVAKEYVVGAAKLQGDTALVEVAYKLLGIGDAHGTRAPASSNEHRVQFHLRKIKGRWKIERPLPNEIEPVVLATKFPYARQIFQ